jgi:hypothetical protein
MTTPAEFREFARECLAWAAEATDEAERQTLVETAEAPWIFDGGHNA